MINNYKTEKCLTFLGNRALAQLALKAGVPVKKVKNVIIWGNHSSTQYPDASHAIIDGHKAPEVRQTDRRVEGQIDRQTDRQTNKREGGMQKDKHGDRKTDKPRETI